MCIFDIPQTDLSVGVLTVLVRGLDVLGVPVALPVGIFYCKLQYLVTPTLNNHRKINISGELLHFS